MRKLLSISVILLLLLQCQKKEGITKETAQTHEKVDSIKVKDTNEPPDEEHIQWIKKQYATINAKKIKPQSFTFTCDVENTINYYFDNGKIIKISIQWGYLGDGESYTEYYYDQDNVFFYL